MGNFICSPVLLVSCHYYVTFREDGEVEETVNDDRGEDVARATASNMTRPLEAESSAG